MIFDHKLNALRGNLTFFRESLRGKNDLFFDKGFF